MFLIKNLFTESTPINEEYDMIAEIPPIVPFEGSGDVAATPAVSIPYGNKFIETAYAASPFKNETVTFLGINYPYVVSINAFPKTMIYNEPSRTFNRSFFESLRQCNVFIIDFKEYHYYCAFMQQIIPIATKHCGTYDIFASFYNVTELFADYLAASEINEDYMFFKIKNPRIYKPLSLEIIPVFTVNREVTVTDEQIEQLKKEYYYLNYAIGDPVVCSKQINVVRDYMFLKNRDGTIVKVPKSYNVGLATIVDESEITESTYYTDYCDNTPFLIDESTTTGIPFESGAYGETTAESRTTKAHTGFFSAAYDYKAITDEIARELAQPETRAFHRKALENMHNNDFETEYAESYNPDIANTNKMSNFEQDLFKEACMVDRSADLYTTQHEIDTSQINAKVAHFDKMMDATIANQIIPDNEKFHTA